MSAIRIVVGNNKGGAGKTFTALALAEAAALFFSARILFVDMDPQANATRRLGLNSIDWLTLADCLKPGVRNGDGERYVVPHGWGASVGLAIDVIPADLGLEDRVYEAGTPGAERRLRNALWGIDEQHDLTIIDCPPSIGHLSNMALAACDGQGDTVLVPMRPEADDIGGAIRTAEHIRLNRDNLGVADLTVSGFIMNGIRENTSHHSKRLGQLADVLPNVPILAQIPLRTAIATVQDLARPLMSDPALTPILEKFYPIAQLLMPSKVSTHGQ